MRIINASNKDLKINNINVLGNRQPLVYLQPTTADRSLTFHLDRDVSPEPGGDPQHRHGRREAQRHHREPDRHHRRSSTPGRGPARRTTAAMTTPTTESRGSRWCARTCCRSRPTGDGQSVGSRRKRINVDIVDAAGLPAPTSFETRRVDEAANAIFLGYENLFFQGQQVRYDLVSGTAIDGLEDGGYYYVIASSDGLSIQLAATRGGRRCRHRHRPRPRAGDPRRPAQPDAGDAASHVLEADEDVFLDVLGRQRGLTADYA